MLEGLGGLKGLFRLLADAASQRRLDRQLVNLRKSTLAMSPRSSFHLNLSPTMNILFVADPLASFKIYKDTTFAMMREAQRRGHSISACETKDIMWQRGTPVTAFVRDIHLTGDAHNWFTAEQQYPDERPQALRDFGCIIMRKDPPFDSEFFYSTHLLEQAEREGARVFNKPSALRDHPEKLAIMAFQQFIGPTLVTRDASDIKRFHAEHQDIILKPLDGMGGTGIFRVKADGLNLGSIIETLNKEGSQSVMVQKFLPAIAKGDKRVLVIGGKPVPFVLARIPQGNEVRGNLATGGLGVAQALSARDREIAEAAGPVLAARGLLLAGIDVIGDCITEINVTSPTCFQEIFDQTDFDVAAMFIDALEAALATPA
jgi:glutathione synthase